MVPAACDRLPKNPAMTSQTDAPGSDTLLLEALFELAISGRTEGWEFERIDAEVHERLRTTYPPPAQPVKRVRGFERTPGQHGG